MATQHKTRGRGNTKNPTLANENSRFRNWCFTLNNYVEEDIEHIKSIGKDYVFQEETGANGTKHLQGLIIFKSAKTFSAVHKLLCRAHIEVCRDVTASIAYCSKQDTRTGNIYVSAQLHNKISEKIDDKIIVKKKTLTEDEITELCNEEAKLKMELPSAEKWKEIVGEHWIDCPAGIK